MTRAIALLFALAASPVAAQHAGHGGHAGMQQAEPEKAPASGADPADGKATAKENAASGHSGMDHGTMNHGSMNHDAMNHGSMDHSSMSQGTMDHGTMDHSGMDHGRMNHGAVDQSRMTPQAADNVAPAPGAAGAGGAPSTGTVPTSEAPPPAAAGSGPARAADAIWGADAMRASRQQLKTENGGQRFFWFMADRAEYRARDGRDGYLWDLQGFYGGDIDKFFYKSEGEGSFGERPESAEVQALWSHAIGPWFDLQAGVRQDFAPRDRTYAVIGVQGLAPYRFEVDTALFLSDTGDLTARAEAELDQRITQRLILQPRAEFNLAAQDVPELGIGAGLDRAELGLRLRYEIAREFAPYMGIEQEWRVGRSADFARAEGERPSATNFVAGVRLWF
ncbi:copper resistance protein B [Novosphingopyxis sp. YJ-S2-01]|uniref:copper resistance protein B n=1 Tax=Novosphingopyxis sp. YJ-S2-01 TaxID=2794021 RepID=UPI0018DD1CDE|nr:copper resistance protein B [Novosphingopyxis sp. YJ-S2-01]